MSAQQKLLVIGLGELGEAILTALHDHPSSSSYSLYVLLRNTPSSTSPRGEFLSHNNAQVQTGDIVNSTVEDLAEIFKDYEIVIGCSGMHLPPGTQLKLTQAILRAKVGLWIPWQFGMDYDVIDSHRSKHMFEEQMQVRRLLRGQQDVRWNIVSTGLFMSFLFEPAFGVVDLKNHVVRALGQWDNRMTMTTPKDIGRTTAEPGLQRDTSG